jgi:hypothetical protein
MERGEQVEQGGGAGRPTIAAVDVHAAMVGEIRANTGHCLPLGALLVELFQRHGHGRRPALAVLHGSAQPLRRPGAVVGFGDDRGIGPEVSS